MKKSFVIITALSILSIAIVSCGSKSKVENNVPVSPDEEIVLLSQEEKAALDKQQAIESLFDLSWTKKSNKNVDVVLGKVRLRSKKNLGTFNLSVMNDEDKTIPVLSTANEYVTSSCYLKAGNKIIKLNQDSAVKSYSRRTDLGMQIAYEIDKVGIVILDFQCFSSDPKKTDFDSVKITAAVKNTGKKRNDFELKFILDTVLGETDRHHFYGSDGLPVKNELEIRNPGKNDWFVSQNANASMTFNFSGLEATQANVVALANYSTLDAKNWKPDLLNYRAFDTVLSYNNSAVGVLWSAKKLSINECYNEIFYITLGCDGEKVKENPLNLEAKKKNEVTDKTQEEKKPAVNQNTQTTVEPVKEEKSEEPKKETKEDVIPAYKLSQNYIMELLDRIENLSEDDSVSKAEIEELNAELDTIIELMRN